MIDDSIRRRVKETLPFVDFDFEGKATMDGLEAVLNVFCEHLLDYIGTELVNQHQDDQDLNSNKITPSDWAKLVKLRAAILFSCLPNTLRCRLIMNASCDDRHWNENEFEKLRADRKTAGVFVYGQPWKVASVLAAKSYLPIAVGQLSDAHRLMPHQTRELYSYCTGRYDTSMQRASQQGDKEGSRASQPAMKQVLYRSLYVRDEEFIHRK
jgi:hypothetical protein